MTLTLYITAVLALTAPSDAPNRPTAVPVPAPPAAWCPAPCDPLARIRARLEDRA